MKVSVEIELPSMPNYLITMGEGTMKIDVGSLDYDSLERIIEEWGAAFTRHVEHRRKLAEQVPTDD